MATRKHGYLVVGQDGTMHLLDASTGNARKLTATEKKNVAQFLQQRRTHGKQLAKTLGGGLRDAYIIDHAAPAPPPSGGAAAPASAGKRGKTSSAAKKGAARAAGKPKP